MDATERLASVEARLARVEGLLGLVPRAAASPRSEPAGPVPRAAGGAAPPPPSPVHAPAPVSIPVTPPPAPVRARRPAARAERPARDLERLLGVAVLGRVGIASLLLAAAYFAQLAYRSLSPEARVLGIYALAGALVAVGALLRARVAPRYVALLWGGGVAAAYLAGVVAKLRYDLVGPVPAVAMLVASCALGQALARLAKAQVLAHVALVGAFAAPVLVGAPTDARTALLAYLLALHAWAAWTARGLGWTAARPLGIVGVLVVAGLWLARHGGLDASTYLHVHLYLVGLAAPEILDGLRGRALGPARVALLLTFLSIAEGIATLLSLFVPRLAAAPALAGLAWLAVAAGWRLAKGTPAADGVRGLARLAGVLLAVGATRWAAGLVPAGDLPPVVFASLAGVAVAALLGRRWLGVGDGAALLASVLALGMLGAEAPPSAWTALALVGPAALVLGGGATGWRQAGLGLAALACFVGIPPVGDASWLLAAFTAATATVTAARLLALRRRDDGLALAADVSLLAVGACWSWHAFAGDFASAAVGLWNEGTAAAALLAVALVIRRPWRTATPPSRADDLRALPAGLLVAVLALAGWREVLLSTASISVAGAREALRALYVALASGALLLLAVRRGQAALRPVALAGLALAAGMACAHLAGPVHVGWAAAEVVGIALVATAAARGSPAGHAASRLVGAALALLLAAAWALRALGGGIEASAAFANLRFGAGVALLVLVEVSRRADPRLLGHRVDAWLSGATALLAFGVGRVEVARATAGLAVAPALAWASLYAAAWCALVLAVAGRSRAVHLRWMALGGLAFLACVTAGHLTRATLPWAAAEVAGAACVAFAAARARSALGDGGRVVALSTLAFLGASWAVAGWGRGLGAPEAFVNLRFALGLGLVVALELARRRLQGTSVARLAAWVSGFTALLAFAVGWIDLRAALERLPDPAWRAAIASVYGTAASAVVLALGFRAKAPHLRWMGLAGFGVVVAKVGLLDLAAVDTPFRVLVTGCLGVVLLLAAYAYARKARREEAPGAPPPAPSLP